MPLLSKPALYVLQHPIDFAHRVLAGFGRNQGVLLAGAVAYYALLSVVPLLVLLVGILSHFVDQTELLETAGRYLEWLAPSQSKALLVDVSGLLGNRIAISAFLILTMLFFSSLTFSVLQRAMAVIFAHRKDVVKRHALVAAVLPYIFVFFLGLALLVVTIGSIALEAMAEESIYLVGRDWSLRGLSGLLFYLMGFVMETLIFTGIYLLLPVGRNRLHQALIGGLSATVIWEIIRHILVWYFTTLSKASIVYGSLTTAVVALFSMELAATLLLLGAQVIAEYEQLDT